jgi:hypothetical protein
MTIPLVEAAYRPILALLIFMIALAPLVILSVPLLFLTFFAVCVMVMVCIAYVSLYPAELILRRIAEYPKGPILAVSALAGAIAAFAKVFSGQSTIPHTSSRASREMICARSESTKCKFGDRRVGIVTNI